MHQRSAWVWMGYGLVWLLLTLLAVVAVWQAHVTTLYLATLLIDNPAWRPSGWSMNSLVGVSKLSVLIWGSCWLITVLYMENRLRTSVTERRLLLQTGRFAAVLAACLLAAYLIPWFG
ncbi:MAG: hypothetical protein R3C14_22920 [Caldilineaceae bacterium]